MTTIWAELPFQERETDAQFHAVETNRLLSDANHTSDADPERGAAVLLGAHVHALLAIEAQLRDLVTAVVRVAEALERAEVGPVQWVT